MRARFRGLSMLRLPLQALGDGSIAPGGVLGGDMLRRYSVDFRFGGGTCGRADCGSCPSMTFWQHLGADLGFLQDAGYAVIRFSLDGGGEITADGDPDVFGQRGPLVLPPTRVVLRTCAVPADFRPRCRARRAAGGATPPGWRPASTCRCCSTPASGR